ncbi:hypothetical protein ABIF68_002501 [Bradyrhizobium japonicum]
MTLKLAVGLVVLITVTAMLTDVPDATAGTCRKEPKKITIVKGKVVQLGGYTCRLDADAQAEVRVQIQRLSGYVPGSLLNGGTGPWSNSLYGKHRIKTNEVLVEYRSLLEKFGSTVMVKDEIGTELEVQPEQQQAVVVDYPERTPTFRTFMLPEFPDIPLVDETIDILTKQTWPTSLKMNYGSRNWPRTRVPLDDMTVWRYLTRSDAADYKSRLQRYNHLVTDRSFDARPIPKAMQFLNYVTAGGWPDMFLYSSAQIVYDEGCFVLDFQTHKYEFAVDVAVIENTSSKPIQLDELLGRTVGDNQLRPMNVSSSRGDGTTLKMEPGSLGPSERLIVPLKLAFLTPWRPDRDEQAKSRRISQDLYQKIINSRPGTVFQTELYSSLRGIPAKQNTYRVRKVRESFKPPEYPEESDYAFGPEWILTGLTVNGETILFDAAPPFNRVYAFRTGVGSCPILYAWSHPDATWARHGRIIHQAESRSNEQSETITFDGLVHRFRIAEEELERATITNLRLEIQLSDGSMLSLLPDGPFADHRRAIELHANDEAEINFRLPEGVTYDRVLSSRLTITGYYDRYSALLISQMGPNSSKVRLPNMKRTSYKH